MMVWKLVKPPPGQKLVRNYWIFEFKMNDQKEEACFKACLIVQEFSQVLEINFHQIYSDLKNPFHANPQQQCTKRTAKHRGNLA